MFAQMINQLNCHLTENTPYDLKIVLDYEDNEACQINLRYNGNIVGTINCHKHQDVYCFDDNGMIYESIVNQHQDVDAKILTELMYEHKINHMYGAWINKSLVLTFDHLPVDVIVNTFSKFLFLSRQWYQVIAQRLINYQRNEKMIIKMNHLNFAEAFNEDKTYQFEFGDGTLNYSVTGRLMQKLMQHDTYQLALISRHVPTKVMGNQVIAIN